MVDRSSRLLLSIIVGISVMRNIGPFEYSHVAFYLMVLSMVQASISISNDGVLLRENAKSQIHSIKISKSAMMLRLFSSFALIIFAFIWIYFSPEYFNDKKPILWLAILSGILYCFDPMEQYAQANFISKEIFYKKQLIFFIFGITKVIAAFEGHAIHVIYIYTLELIALSFVYCNLAIKSGFIDVKVSFSDVFQLLKHSTPFWLTGLMLVFTSQMDMYFVSLKLDSKDVGNYGATKQIVLTMQILIGVLASGVIPIANKIYYHNRVKFKDLTLKIYVIGFFVAFSMYFASNFFVGNYAEEILGYKYSHVKELFPIISLSFPIALFGTITSLYVTLYELHIVQVLRVTFGFLVALCLSVIYYNEYTAVMGSYIFIISMTISDIIFPVVFFSLRQMLSRKPR